MISAETRGRLSLLIIRSSMKGKYAANQIADTHNLTVMAEMTLCLLELNKAIPMKHLSSFLGCDPSNVTGIIEQLVNEGLVKRKEAAHDRRIKTVTLTKKGLAMREAFLTATTHARLPNLDNLTEEETEQLTRILSKAAGTSTTEGISIAASV